MKTPADLEMAPRVVPPGKNAAQIVMTSDEVTRLGALPVEELRRRARTPFRLLSDMASVLEDFAQSIVSEIRTRNQRNEPTRPILPVGPVAHYGRVVELCNREKISWKNVFVFTMDEFLDWQARPVGVAHPLSFEGYMRRAVFEKLDPEIRIPESHLCFPNPNRIDEPAERIREAGGIDVCYGGIGYHGHVAFNEPPLSRWHRVSLDQLRNSLTRIVQLGDDSIVVQSINSAGGNSAAIPPMAVTLGMRDILASRKIRLYCCGGQRHKTIFRITVAGEPSIEYPSTLVQSHPDAEVITDEATGAPVELRFF